MEQEIATINDNHTWELVPMDQCPVRPIGCKWVYRIKLNSDGTIAKFKSRIVAKGFSEVLGQHYQADEVYSPVCSYDTLRVMLSVATQRAWRLYQADIVGAYLQSVLPTPTWMRQPEGFEVLDEQGRPFVCKLRKGLYGTKSGGYHWHRTFDEYVRSIGFVQATGDVCLYLLADHSFGAPDNAEIMLCVYVDDLSIATSTTDAYNWFISTLSRRFPINSDETGALDWMLSMSVKYDIDAGTIKLTQTVAIERLYMVPATTAPSLSSRTTRPASPKASNSATDAQPSTTRFAFASSKSSSSARSSSSSTAPRRTSWQTRSPNRWSRPSSSSIGNACSEFEHRRADGGACWNKCASKYHTRPRSHKGRRSPPQGTRNPACSLTLFPVTDTTGVTPLAKPKRVKAQLPKYPPPLEPQTPKYPELGGTCLDSSSAGPCRPETDPAERSLSFCRTPPKEPQVPSPPFLTLCLGPPY